MAAILVVDDEPKTRALVEQILQRAGHTVTTAGDGAAALRALQHDRFDLVVTDMYMPEVDGVELLARCRKDHPQLPIVAISGGDLWGDTHILDAGRLLGAQAVLAKPFKPDDLTHAVDQALAGVNPPA